MRNFSIIPSSNQGIIEQYSDFLSREVYYRMPSYTYDNLNDPLFLQKLGVLQAEGIRRAINNNSVIAIEGFEETNATISNSTNYIGNKIGNVANMLTSSLDKGFMTLNHSLVSIDSGINIANTHLASINSGIQTTNVHLSNIDRGIDRANVHLSNINAGVQTINNNLTVLGNLIGQSFSILHNQLAQSNNQLGFILQELKIPETQRERRYHIEEGTKYLTLALQNGENLYFDDAFDEFNTALSFEKKDWYSWFNIGLIHLRSITHIDPQKAIDAFKKTVHYCQAEVVYTKNANLEHKIDEAHLYMAETYYIQQEYKNAVSETEVCIHNKNKADFMKVKYLSASNEPAKQQEAAKLLSKQINENPYITLQVLEDDDILRNRFVINLLEEYHKKSMQRTKTLLLQCKQDMIKNSLVGNYIKEIEQLLQTNSYLDSVEALKIFDEVRIWSKTLLIPNGFSGTIQEFIKYERQISDVIGITNEWWEKLSTLEIKQAGAMIEKTDLPENVIRGISNIIHEFVEKKEIADNVISHFDRDGIVWSIINKSNTPSDALDKILKLDVCLPKRCTANILRHCNTSLDTLWYFVKKIEKDIDSKPIVDFYRYAQSIKIELADAYKHPRSTKELKTFIKKRIVNRIKDSYARKFLRESCGISWWN